MAWTAAAFPQAMTAGWQDGPVDVLSSRILLRPADPGRSCQSYRDLLGLAVYREFGSPADPGMVFFLGGGLLEVSGRVGGRPAGALSADLAPGAGRARRA
jgi:hypothetical protein